MARRDPTLFVPPEPVSATRWFERAGDTAARRYARVLAKYRDHPVFSLARPPPPAARVTVLVPTLNEEDYVEDACRSLASQTLKRAHPDLVEIMLVDSGSEDATRDLARPHVDRTLLAPRGKLNALVAGIAHAKGEIIVEADADGLFPPSWVALMVKAFEDPGVAAVRGTFVYYDSPLLRILSAPLRRALGGVGNFPGGVRAYRRSAFLAGGGFDTRVDQKDFWDVWPEEEFRFPRRLTRSGRLVTARSAVCFKSARRGDPVFVRDARADNFRKNLESTGRFQDGVTDRIYRARKILARLTVLK